MTFIWPYMLFSLILVPLLAGAYLLVQRRRRRILEEYGNFGLLQAAAGTTLGIRRYIPPTLFLASLAIFMIALARPQMVVSLPKEEGTVILAFDVSGSMAATDLKPTRLDAAKAAAQDFIQRQPATVQIGVVAFSDSGFEIQTPTIDKNTVLAAINRLTPQRGTSIGNGIQVALKAIDTGSGDTANLYSSLPPTPAPTPTPVPKGTYTSAVIVLLTDGENNMQPNPLTAAQTAADQGVRIYTVGIGSAAGTTLHINGFNVFTKLDEATLQQISLLTGGTYFNAQNAQDLLKIYDNLNPSLVIKPEKTEVTSLFAGAGILVMLIGGVFSLLWFNRLP
ncbi:MAG: VWA domain-containing protein [Chloroflexi bacterium]|nr:VWA domain-containing protein [Chloroflexota bacterium]